MSREAGSERRRAKLSLTQAVEIWTASQRSMDGLKLVRDEAAVVVLAHAKRTGRRTYKDQIAVTETGGTLILDQRSVRELLGARLQDFQTRTKRGLSLRLLK
jgi:urease gamma subunit